MLKKQPYKGLRRAVVENGYVNYKMKQLCGFCIGTFYSSYISNMLANPIILKGFGALYVIVTESK